MRQTNIVSLVSFKSKFALASITNHAISFTHSHSDSNQKQSGIQITLHSSSHLFWFPATMALRRIHHQLMVSILWRNSFNLTTLFWWQRQTSVCLALWTKPVYVSSWLPAPAVCMVLLFTQPGKWTSLNTALTFLWCVFLVTSVPEQTARVAEQFGREIRSHKKETSHMRSLEYLKCSF